MNMRVLIPWATYFHNLLWNKLNAYLSFPSLSIFSILLDDDFIELKDSVIIFIPDNLHIHFDKITLKYSFTR